MAPILSIRAILIILLQTLRIQEGAVCVTRFQRRRNKTLAEYSAITYAHLIRDDVAVLEYDGRGIANKL